MTGKDNNTNRPVTNSTSRVSSKPDSSSGKADPSKEVAAARGSFQPRQYQSQTQTLSKAKSSMANDKPRPTPQEARQTYYKWLERLEARAREDQETKALLDSTRELTTRLEEPNILAVYRLVEIFGLLLVKGMVDKVLTLHKEAAGQGEVAYKPRENPRAIRPEHRMVGTEVATAKGQPRTPGGIFFFLMRGYVTRLRLAWEDLRVPWLPEESTQNTATSAEGQNNEADPDEGSKANGKRNQDGPGGSEPTSGISKVTNPLVNTPVMPAGNAATKAPSVSSLVSGEQGVKPSRGKVIITGSPTPGSQIKVAPQGLAGVLELLFEIEPGANPAKGLPVLEKTLVKVWCTDKQYSKIKPSLNPNSRYLIEGEIGAGTNSQTFQPFIRVLTTRITTLELEQEAKVKKAEQSNPA